MQILPPQRRKPLKSKAKLVSRDVQRLLTTLEEVQILYQSSQFAMGVAKYLPTALKRSPVEITRLLSLGLGSLLVTKSQSRRLKQIAILLAIRSELEVSSVAPIEIYAQDPTFTRLDEAFLASLDIKISHTSSGSSLGEAATLISPKTMIYSPFLTIEAYEQLLMHQRLPIPLILGDDFDALSVKWPKHSEERKQLEVVMKLGLSRYRRRSIQGHGFWTEEDGAFPMAMYGLLVERGWEKVRAKI